jgi:hypothetical protein
MGQLTQYENLNDFSYNLEYSKMHAQSLKQKDGGVNRQGYIRQIARVLPYVASHVEGARWFLSRGLSCSVPR